MGWALPGPFSFINTMVVKKVSRFFCMALKSVLSSRKKVVIVVSRFNPTITQRLVDACIDELSAAGVSSSQIKLVWVPGAFEIPLAAKVSALRESVAAVICLGAVIKGQTEHYHLIIENVARGIMDVGLEVSKPIVFEVLACETFELANQRSKPKGANKGRDAARVALEMVNLLQTL